MHVSPGAWRCCDGKGRADRVQCELLLAANFAVLCWTLYRRWYVLLGSSKKITSRNHWITAFSQINGCYSSRCPSCLTKALHQRVWGLPSANVCEASEQTAPAVTCCWNKTILQQPKPSTFCIMFNLTLIFYPHHTGMRPEILYTNGSFEISQERMFVKQRRTYDWSTCLLSKKTFMLKQKSSNLSIIGFNSVRNFLSDCLSTFH